MAFLREIGKQGNRAVDKVEGKICRNRVEDKTKERKGVVQSKFFHK